MDCRSCDWYLCSRCCPLAEAIGVGDRVEISGLTSESGKQLNGQQGTVKCYLEDKDRFQIELGPENIVSIRPANLRRIGAQQGSDEAGEEAKGGEATAGAQEGASGEKAEEAPRPLAIGDWVEVHGLESESGSKLNGRSGVIREHLEDKDRFKVELAPEEVISVKPVNLRRCPPPASGEGPQSADKSAEKPRSGSASSSSSSSSGASRKRSAKAPRQPEGLSPEETLERLLTGRSTKRRKKSSSGKFGYSKEPDDFPHPTGVPTVDPADIAADAARATQAAAAMAAAAVLKSKEPLKVGDRVEVYGLQSEAGKQMNGKSGLVTKFLQEKGRYQVELGMANLQSLKPENLRHAAAPSAFVETNYGGSTAGYTLL